MNFNEKFFAYGNVEKWRELGRVDSLYLFKVCNPSVTKATFLLRMAKTACAKLGSRHFTTVPQALLLVIKAEI